MNLKTNRLILRQWTDEDLEPFATMNGDPRVMEYFPSTMTRTESDALAEKIRLEFKEKPYGLFAVEVIDGPRFIGFVGLHEVSPDLPFSPAIEIGWRLSSDQWGKGYATEAAQKVVEFARDKLQLSELVSFTTVKNAPSRRVMEKLGMTHNPEEDFDHPKVAEGSPVRPHVLYRLSLSVAQ